MAATLSTSPLLDPTKAAKIPIAVGEHLLRNSEGAEARQLSIQCKPGQGQLSKKHAYIVGNYKPPFRQRQTARIRPSRRPSHSHVALAIKNEDEPAEYSYTGTQQPSGACALVYNPSTNTFVLDKLDVDFTFNLQSTPSNANRNEVTSQYPQLDTGVSDIESEDGNLAELSASNVANITDADMNNPYDYRHFLKRRRSSSPEAPPSGPSLSPAVQPRRLSRTNTKPKPRPRPMQRPNRPPPREEVKQVSDESDDEVLTIEMGDDPKPRRFGNGAVVFNHDRRNGPISLRSAASSMSPASMRHESGNEDVDSDKDVEHLQLPSPSGRSDDYEVDGEEGDDEDDDGVIGDLMDAMESQAEEEEEEANARAAEDPTIRRTIEESSSESEEE
ncbi:MAG: hypothetical protein Q9200_000366 [Gallowayella weberi]